MTGDTGALGLSEGSATFSFAAVSTVQTFSAVDTTIDTANPLWIRSLEQNPSGTETLRVTYLYLSTIPGLSGTTWGVNLAGATSGATAVDYIVKYYYKT
jgi:hypothetical protein